MNQPLQQLQKIQKVLFNISWPIIAAMVALMAVGVKAIEISQRSEAVAGGSAQKQIIFACIAVVAFIVAAAVPYQRIGRLAYPAFGVVLVLLIGVFFVDDARGSHRWYDFFGVVKFQPSELAKVSYILLLAWYLRRGDNYRKLTGLLVPAALALVPMALILKEPDLGTCLLFPPVLFFMLFMAGAKLRHLGGVVVLVLAAMFLPIPRQVNPSWAQAELADRQALSYYSTDDYIFSAAPLAMMEYHQIKRIDGWLRQGREDVARNKGYQLAQSKMTLGAGGARGRGDWNDADSFFRLLPDDHTDFIFAVIGGQWGFTGCVAVLMLYGVIFLFGIEIAAATYDAFGRMLAVGVLALLLSQLLINIGMTMGLMPITGMTLPLISYGGSSLVVNGMALGLLVNVGLRRPILLSRRPFEFGDKKEFPPAPYGPLAGDGKGVGKL